MGLSSLASFGSHARTHRTVVSPSHPPFMKRLMPTGFRPELFRDRHTADTRGKDQHNVHTV